MYIKLFGVISGHFDIRAYGQIFISERMSVVKILKSILLTAVPLSKQVKMSHYTRI